MVYKKPLKLISVKMNYIISVVERILYGTGRLLEVDLEVFWWVLMMICWMWYKWRLEFTLLACWCFDKIAKSRWNLIDVYGDAQIDGKVAFLA